MRAVRAEVAEEHQNSDEDDASEDNGE